MTMIDWMILNGVFMVIVGFLIRHETVNSEGWGDDNSPER